jgi:hypothetical protein
MSVSVAYNTEKSRILEQYPIESDKLTAYRNGFLATFGAQKSPTPDPFDTYITRLVYYNLYVQEVIKKITAVPSGTGSAIAISTQHALTASREATLAATQAAARTNVSVPELKEQIAQLNAANNALEQTIKKYNTFFTQSMEHVEQIVKMYPQATALPGAD